VDVDVDVDVDGDGDGDDEDHDKENESEDTIKKVFLENLPIDITEEELFEAVRHCGTIKELNVFNRRPDLDPLNVDFDKKNKEALLIDSHRKTYFSFWHKKKKSVITPVHAIVEFKEDQTGDLGALRSSYRLFGFVIRKHAIKTIPIRDDERKFNRLWINYLDEISGLQNLSLEHKLNNVLNPHLFVQLDDGEHHNGSPSSVCISFANHKLCNQAYTMLRDGGLEKEGLAGAELNFRATPINAGDFWTRHLELATMSHDRKFKATNYAIEEKVRILEIKESGEMEEGKRSRSR